ncbi:MAG TPA: RsmB/NOP family class I SAM-dependent RNA methyltransferase [Rhizomicrobium sp.]|nr:RsmB/NOP family class I SAM-dependent RNA methyltransferase [Rhizomicrobium sp.]
MTPAARVQATIEILEALDGTNQAVDRFLRDWFRARRYAGAKDRAAIAERVFSVLRHRASLGWRMQSETPRALVIASLIHEGAVAVENLFSGAGYGPASLNDVERTAIVSERSDPPPLWVQGEFPGFLEPELARGLGDDLLDDMQAMLERAPVDLRVNTLKASRDEVLRELGGAGFAVVATPYAPHGIRLVERNRASQLRSTRAFLDGRFEFQDEAAQIASMLCAAKPGQQILDLAAGAGGKALAIAAAMNNEGVIVARDNDAARLAQLGPRATRAGVTILREQFADAETPAGPFDAVFVDAPCSGSGAWRRQPEQKWRLTPRRLAELQTVQNDLLDHAAAATNARIVYATCSILMCENEDRIEAFLARHPDFRIVPAGEIWREITDAPAPTGMDQFFKATPRTTGTDGFFAAILARRS